MLAAVALSTLMFRVWSPRAGLTMLSATLLGLAVARLRGPEPGLPGVAVRSRRLDVVGYVTIAVVVLLLAYLTPSLVGMP